MKMKYLLVQILDEEGKVLHQHSGELPKELIEPN